MIRKGWRRRSANDVLIDVARPGIVRSQSSRFLKLKNRIERAGMRKQWDLVMRFSVADASRLVRFKLQDGHLSSSRSAGDARPDPASNTLPGKCKDRTGQVPILR